jgi:DNA polymerase-1
MQKLIVSKTKKQLVELKEYIKANDYIAFDTETTGLDKESKIIGYSVSADEHTGYYVVLYYWDTNLSQLVPIPETLSQSEEILNSLKIKQLVMHNGIFDCWMVYNNFKIDLMPSLHTDTLLLAHLLDENRHNGLKELGLSLFGEDATTEQKEMKESIKRNGGLLTKANFELYKADADLIARYGAKDAILTIKLFYVLAQQLIEQGLDAFFYDDETMPLLRGPTYDLNTSGLKVDTQKLQDLKGELEARCMELKAFIHKEIAPLVKDKYPGTTKAKTFNLDAPKQRAWLLFEVLKEEFGILTKEGKEIVKALGMKIPYSPAAKRELIQVLETYKGRTYQEATMNDKTKKLGRAKKVGEPWTYLSADKASLKKYELKYEWIKKFLEYNKELKILNTYVIGIQERMKYGIIRPSFLQHGTTSGRYSSRNPNFQNLPRDDKRVKGCIISRPGKVFVGADYSQLEPRVFASFSGDERLCKAFESADDFYSTIGITVFDIFDAVPRKDGSPDAFGIKYKKLRDISKVIALAATYGTTAFKMAPMISKDTQEAQEVIDDYFKKFPKVKQLQEDSHKLAIEHGFVTNLFGRPRRMPRAKLIPAIYGKVPHSELPYEARNLLNLAINHRIQSTSASIMNRAAIATWNMCKELSKTDSLWHEVKIVLQVHDELILEGPEELGEDMVTVLKHCMENTVELPGVKLEALPKIARNLADLK